MSLGFNWYTIGFSWHLHDLLVVPLRIRYSVEIKLVQCLFELIGCMIQLAYLRIQFVRYRIQCWRLRILLF